MNIIVKGRHGFDVPEKLNDYVTEKIRKYEKIIEEPATCDVMLADVRGPQNGVDKVIHITLELPNEKQPIHVEAISDDFFASVDLAQEKLEQQLLRYKERKKIGERFPKKEYVAKLEEEEAGEEK